MKLRDGEPRVSTPERFDEMKFYLDRESFSSMIVESINPNRSIINSC